MDRIFYKSAVSDAYTGYPIYIFDTSYLPAPEEVDYDLFVPALMVLLPEDPYVVVMFNGGLNKINWIWGIKFLRSFLAPDSKDVRSIDNLHMMIAVHESWFVRSLSQIFTNFAFSKWANLNFLSDTRKKNLLVSCATLSDLHSYVDITTLKLSLNVYIHDAQITMNPNLQLTPAPEPVVVPSTTFDQSEFPLFYHHFYQVFHIVNTYAADVEMLFHKPGNKLHTAILYACMMRNQLVWINDWDLNCIALCFKKLLREVHGPLIDVDLIPLPMKDDLQYTSMVFDQLMGQKYANEVLFQILDLCHRIIVNNELTKHTLSTLLKSLCTVLTHEPIMQENKFRIAVSLRFFKNLVDMWPTIRKPYVDRFHTVQEIVDNRINKRLFDRLFISYDMTMEDASDEDLLVKSVLFGTVNSLDITSVCLGLDEEQSRDVEDSGLIDNTDHSKRSVPHKSNGNDGIDGNTIAGSKQETIVEGPIFPSKPPPAPMKAPRNTELQNDFSCDNDQVFVDTGAQRMERLTLQPKCKPAPREPEVALQFPPQKYKFERKAPMAKFDSPSELSKTPVKKLVVRGRKVGELTRLFEERAEAMQILQNINI